MDYKLLNEKYSACCHLVTNKQLYEAFSVLSDLVKESKNGDLSDKLENYRETYSNILGYSFGEVEDPEKKTVYFKLLRSVIELADEAKESIISSQQLLNHTKVRRINISPEDIKDFTELFNADELLLNTAINPITKSEIEKLFNILWLSNKYRDTEKEIAVSILNSEKAPWWLKSLIVSAITLSLQRYFDEEKVFILTNTYKQTQKQVWQRALTGLLITLYQYNQRLFLYPRIKGLLVNLYLECNVEKQVELAIIQFIKSRETEKITRKFQDEILPEMAKIQSRVHDKLDLKNIIQDPFSDEKNPDWENVFQDTPDLLNKLEELSKLQIEGSDVFMSTFSMLKQFGFFDSIFNWLIPFYKENEEVQQMVTGEGNNSDIYTFIEGLEKSSILCNSDKYSFCLNLGFVPPENRNTMMELFNMEVKTMEEISEDDKLLNKPSYERIVFTQYIQDLYRFYKLYSRKEEFYDFFSSPMDFHNTEFFKWLINSDSVIRNIGELYFEKEYYKEAIEVFSQLDNEKSNPELWQKIAYGYQKNGDFQKALEYYLKADLAEIRNSWNVKKIALCYRRLGYFSKALEYYLIAERLEPENLNVQTNLAHTYLDMKDYENALKYYFKVEFLAPANIKIQRPIAWCSFMLKKLDTAKKYFEKIIDIEGNRHDFLNLGHVEWCLGNKKAAIERYKQSIEKADFGWFAKELSADSEILISYGIDPINIPLMRDYLKMQK
jgi:tetratricopeptide (TPR) repeat protein